MITRLHALPCAALSYLHTDLTILEFYSDTITILGGTLRRTTNLAAWLGGATHFVRKDMFRVDIDDGVSTLLLPSLPPKSSNLSVAPSHVRAISLHARKMSRKTTSY